MRREHRMIWIGIQWDGRRCKIIKMMLANLTYDRYILYRVIGKPNNGKMMLRITGLDGLGEYVREAEDVKVDYPDTLAL